MALGGAAASAALLAGFHAELSKHTPLPAAHLLLLAIGVPGLATVAGYLLAGREPKKFSRQALD